MRPEQFIFLGTTVSRSSVFTFKAVIVINSTVASHKIHCFEIETDKRDSLALVVRAEEGCCQCCVTLYHPVSCVLVSASSDI